MLALRLLAFVGGLLVVVVTINSAVRAFVLPRSSPEMLFRLIFLGIRVLFDVQVKRAYSYEERDGIMALYAPVALLCILPIWLVCVLLGFMGMFWSAGTLTWYEAFVLSGSSLLTLGFAVPSSLFTMVLAFLEATIGLILVALLIAYLPTMYSAFSRRETVVNLLEVRAGSPPSAVEMILRLHRLDRLHELHDLWVTWEVWFVEVEESHTSLAPLIFFRSPQADHSWITAAGAVLDSAALINAVVDIPRNPRADLCIRAGYLALRRIADFFSISYNANPTADDPISITESEFREACARLEAQGVPLKADREQAWRDFVGWRVNYDTALLSIAGLTMAPLAPWSSDRSLRPRISPLVRRRQIG